MFVTIEGEMGNVNGIIWPSLQEKFLQEALGASLLAVYGTWQSERGRGPPLGRATPRRLIAPALWVFDCLSQLLLNTCGRATTRIRRCHRGSRHRAYDSNGGAAKLPSLRPMQTVGGFSRHLEHPRIGELLSDV